MAQYKKPVAPPISHAEIIRGIGVPHLARNIGLNLSTVYAWAHRGSIPPEWWRMVVHYSRQDGAGRATSLLELSAWPEWVRVFEGES